MPRQTHAALSPGPSYNWGVRLINVRMTIQWGNPVACDCACTHPHMEFSQHCRSERDPLSFKSLFPKAGPYWLNQNWHSPIVFSNYVLKGNSIRILETVVCTERSITLTIVQFWMISLYLRDSGLKNKVSLTSMHINLSCPSHLIFFFAITITEIYLCKCTEHRELMVSTTGIHGSGPPEHISVRSR